MKLKVGIQGIAGSFHSIAAKQHFGSEIELVEFVSFPELAAALENGRIDRAAMAIENSLAGSLLPNYHLILEHQLFAEAEVTIPIAFTLMSKQPYSHTEIKEVLSHPMAFHQCQKLFRKYPNLIRQEVFDTAGAARMIKESGNPNQAALAPADCMDEYGLYAIEKDIRDYEDNSTRFFILRHDISDKKPSFKKKLIIAFRLDHKVGALADLLNQLTLHKAQLSKIQSIPFKEKLGQYQFILDIESYEKGEELMECIFQLTNSAVLIGETIQTNG